MKSKRIDWEIYHEIYPYLTGLIVAGVIRFFVLYGIAIVLVRALRPEPPNLSIIPMVLSIGYFGLEAMAFNQKLNLAISAARARIAYQSYEQTQGIISDEYRELLEETERSTRIG